jgi:hypothetical protein
MAILPVASSPRARVREENRGWAMDAKSGGKRPSILPGPLSEAEFQAAANLIVCFKGVKPVMYKLSPSNRGWA